MNSPVEEEGESIVDQVKITNGGKSIEVTFKNIAEMKWTSYAIKFEYKTAASGNDYVTESKTFLVRTMIFENAAVAFSQTDKFSSPDKYQVFQGYPMVFPALNTNSFPYLHIQVDAQFAGDKDKEDYPQIVYATLQKEDQVPYSMHSDYIEEIKRFQIDVNLE